MPEYLANLVSALLGLGVLTAAICAVLFSARPLWRLAAVPAGLRCTAGETWI